MEIKTSKLSDEDISMIDRINDTEHVLTDQYMPEKLRDAFVRGGERTAVITTQKEYSFHELGRDVSRTAAYFLQQGIGTGCTVALMFRKSYEQLAALKGSDVLADAKDKNDFAIHKTAVHLPDVLDEYKTLYEKNKKLIGWLKIDDTIIDYPVMQTGDNSYYLEHNFNQEYDKNGSLFLDYNCSIYPRSTNLIIYGHHMKSGQMFGQLQKYAKQSYGEKHSIITFDSIYEKATYQVMYVFRSQVYNEDDLVFKYYQFIDANSKKEFDSYMNEMAKMSLYDTGVTASYGDSLLTLSTCDNSQTDGRFVVVAKRIK